MLLCNLLFLKDYRYDGLIYLRTSLTGIVYVWLLWNVLRYWMVRMRRRFPGVGQTFKRVLVTFMGYLVIVTSAQLGIVYLTGSLTRWAGVPATYEVYLTQVLIGLVSMLTIGVGYEIIYFLQKYREAVEESEAVQKNLLQSQYETLKSQVNPHFLFNSLNSLSALIAEDKTQAGAFLDELSSVYRYLLQTNERKLVSLKTELRFIKSFFYLLKARYGAAIDLNLDIDETALDAWLPPLTLQVLVENAIKHNTLLREQPLQISIRTEEACLIVSNNIQRKTIQVRTQPGGLNTISARYRALQFPEPTITDDGSTFRVRLPLLQKLVEY